MCRPRVRGSDVVQCDCYDGDGCLELMVVMVIVVITVVLNGEMFGLRKKSGIVCECELGGDSDNSGFNGEYDSDADNDEQHDNVKEDNDDNGNDNNNNNCCSGGVCKSDGDNDVVAVMIHSE